MIRVLLRREYGTQRAGNLRSGAPPGGQTQRPAGRTLSPPGSRRGTVLDNSATRSSRPDSSVTRRWSRPAVTAARSYHCRAAYRSRRACARTHAAANALRPIAPTTGPRAVPEPKQALVPPPSKRRSTDYGLPEEAGGLDDDDARHRRRVPA